MSVKDNKDGTLNIHGKTYHTVSKRVADFRKAHPISDGWAILTRIAQNDGSTVMVEAWIVAPPTQLSPNGVIVARGWAEEERSNRGVNKTSAIENTETSAIGRALAAAGYGGDGGYASADEMVSALNQQRNPRKSDGQAPRLARDTKGSQGWAYSALEAAGCTSAAVNAYIAGQDGWGHLGEWTASGREQFVKDVQKGQHPDLYTPGES